MRSKTLAVAVGALVALSVPATAHAATLIGSGSVAAEPVLRPLFKAYERKTDGRVHFVYTANGGNSGVKDVQEGRSQFAGQARPPLPSDAGTTYVKLYLDGLCIDVHPSNGLSNLTIKNVHDIYTGDITNWSTFPASGKNTTIDPYGRDTNGGTYNFFSQGVLNGDPPSGNVTALTADGLVKNAVANDPNGIGYFGLAWQGPTVKKLAINGIPCAPSQIKTLHYPLSRFIWLVYPSSNPNRKVQRFADWVRRSYKAGKIIRRSGGVPAFNRKRPPRRHR